MDSLLTALGLKNGSLIGGFLGALISLKFIEDIGKWSIGKRATTVASGAIVAAYCTPLTVEWFELSMKAEGAIAFIGGLFGMSLAGAIIKAMPGLMDAVRQKIGGRVVKEIVFYSACAVLAVVPVLFVLNKVYEDGVLGRAFLLGISFCAWMYLIERLVDGDPGWISPRAAFFVSMVAGFLCWHLARFHGRVLRRKREDVKWPHWVPH